MASRATVAVLAFLALAACGKEDPKEAPGKPPAAGDQNPTTDDSVIDQANDVLQGMLPRPLTAADVESVLLLTAPVDDEGTDYATAARQADVTVPESEWGSMSARVSMAYAQLLLAEHGVAGEFHSPKLKADIEVVRPFKKRLDQMHEERRAKQEKSINRSGHMVSITRPEFVSARMENPENWERFKEPVTERDGFRVRVGVGEQFLAVRALGELGPKLKLQRYAMLPGGYYVQDVDGITIRPTHGK